MSIDPHSQDAPQIKPAAWVQKHSPLIPKSGQVLDLACGRGRHTRYLLQQRFKVLALDRDISGLNDIASDSSLEIMSADLEAGGDSPFKGRRFAGVVVVNYLYRPLFDDLIAALDDGGVLIYQTFMVGNEEFGRPRNPDFLLKENELREVFGGELDVLDFEQGFVEQPTPAVMQKVCAVKG